jgi:hypothetical protein
MARRDTSPLVVLGLIVVSAALPLVMAPRAGAAGEPGFGCKRTLQGTADVNPNPKGAPPLMIGDSTVLLPIPNLTAVGYSVNAKGCRGFRQAVEVAGKLRRKHKLPHLVLLNDYGNGGVSDELIAEALDALGRSRVLGLVTEYDADTGKAPAPTTDVLVKAAKRYPHRIILLDWVKYSLPHHKVEPKVGAWFLPDLFHPNFDGAEAYAQFLTRALPVAREGVFPPL